MSEPSSDSASGVESISERHVAAPKRGCMVGFFAVFLLAGLGFLLIFLLPAIKVVEATTWAATDCEIVASWVESHSGSDGNTYSVEVRYRYEFDGRRYEGSRYEFMGGSSSGQRSKQEVVDRLAPGTTATCWVDPDEPTESVVYRGLTWVYLFALLPLVFVAIGGGGVYWALTGSRFRSGGDDPDTRFQPAVAAEPVDDREPWGVARPAAGPLELEEAWSPFGKLAVITLLALFWNGIVSVFVWQVVEGWRSGAGFDSGCMTIFLIPFVLIGLMLLAGVPYQLLALVNPRPKLILSQGSVELGERIGLQWSFRGAAHRLRELRIVVEGTESATYRRGTNTHTSTRVFERIEVVSLGSGMPLGMGSGQLRIPIDTMHSFKSRRNKVEWAIKLHGNIRYWPDVLSQFPLIVEPRPAEGDSWRS